MAKIRLFLNPAGFSHLTHCDGAHGAHGTALILRNLFVQDLSEHPKSLLPYSMPDTAVDHTIYHNNLRSAAQVCYLR